MAKKQQQEEKPKILYIEAVGMQGSGWIQDDTIGTANPIEIAWPGRFYIPKTGFRRKEIVDAKGKKSWVNEAIRHIKNSVLISVEEQNIHNVQPSPDPSEDVIFLEKGCGFFVREGGSSGTYDYLEQAYYNESNPDRVARATALYRVIKMQEKDEQDLENEMAAADATKFVGTLYEKKGKVYVYKENAIDGICQMLQVFAESYSGKVMAIQRIAKQRPEWFLDKVVKLQQTTLTEISHALELGVIGFKENAVEYRIKEKLIVTLGNEKMNNDQKIENLADWLRSPEGNDAYTELRAEIEAAKNRELTN